nr:PREDICTED: lachesin-like isoform X1 [Bemisia tabaci]
MEFMCRSIYIVISTLFTLAFSAIVTEEPEFIAAIENVTVSAGRNVKLSCSVKNLGTYKVAWMHFEQSAILTVQNHVITRNPRISMSHDKHTTWSLHIENVQEEDKGRYMCQINTVAAKTQFGYLNVVVPPNIDDALSSSDVIVREGASVNLTCRASGKPPPTIKWRRDGGAQLSRSKNLQEWEGEVMELPKISRLDMGAYLCIANNSVQPAVSKKIMVSVDFPPQLVIPHQLVGAPVGSSVTLECVTEAHPASLNYWASERGDMIHDNGAKYKIETQVGPPKYKTHMKLHIREIADRDFGIYKCISKNPRGETEGTIRLYANHPPTTSPKPTTSTTVPVVPAVSRDPLRELGGKNSNNDNQSGSGTSSGKGSKHSPTNTNEIPTYGTKTKNRDNKMSQVAATGSGCPSMEVSVTLFILLTTIICHIHDWS